MNVIVILDSGPLGLASHPHLRPDAARCQFWLESLLARQTRVVLPEIADYEVRRELLRAGKTSGIARLDALKQRLEYDPISTDVMQLAAKFWADSRRQGRPTAPDHALDGGDNLVVATTNVAHLSRFVDARLWTDIPVPPT